MPGPGLSASAGPSQFGRRRDGGTAAVTSRTCPGQVVSGAGGSSRGHRGPARRADTRPLQAAFHREGSQRTPVLDGTQSRSPEPRSSALTACQSREVGARRGPSVWMAAVPRGRAAGVSRGLSAAVSLRGRWSGRSAA